MILLCWQVDEPITGGGFCASAYCNWKGGGGDEGGLMSSSLQNPRTNLLPVKAVSQWVVSGASFPSWMRPRQVLRNKKLPADTPMVVFRVYILLTTLWP